jgi:hypothetical protein
MHTYIHTHIGQTSSHLIIVLVSETVHIHSNRPYLQQTLVRVGLLVVIRKHVCGLLVALHGHVQVIVSFKHLRHLLIVPARCIAYMCVDVKM